MSETSSFASKEKVQAKRLVLAQLFVTLVVSLILPILGVHYALSALLGGGIATLANALFAYRLFVRYRAQEPGQLLGRMYGAEAQKLVLTVVLFGAVVAWVSPLSIGMLFGSYLLIQAVPMVASHFL